MVCEWCGNTFNTVRPSQAKFCGRRCRQARWRWGICATTAAAADRPMRFAYADPPYPDCADYYPEKTEVDHPSLVHQLREGYPDGWALSTSAEYCRDVWSLCPEARLFVWARPVLRVKSARPLNAWEALLVVGGRPGPSDQVPDVEDLLVYRGRYRAFPGALVGMKPPQFCTWLFQAIGARPGDELVDLFPGSGAVGRAWRDYCGRGTEPSPPGESDVSRAGARYV